MRALGAAALAVAISASLAAAAPAAAQLTAEEIVQVLPGSWELDPSETREAARGDYRCEVDPMHIAIAPGDDGALRYESRRESVEKDAAHRSGIRTLASADGVSSAILIKYEGEERLTDDGQPVEWILVMPDADHFYWVRLDWLETRPGGRTALRRRCEGAAIS